MPIWVHRLRCNRSQCGKCKLSMQVAPPALVRQCCQAVVDTNHGLLAQNCAFLCPTHPIVQRDEGAHVATRATMTCCQRRHYFEPEHSVSVTCVTVRVHAVDSKRVLVLVVYPPPIPSWILKSGRVFGHDENCHATHVEISPAPHAITSADPLLSPDWPEPAIWSSTHTPGSLSVSPHVW